MSTDLGEAERHRVTSTARCRGMIVMLCSRREVGWPFTRVRLRATPRSATSGDGPFPPGVLPRVQVQWRVDDHESFPSVSSVSPPTPMRSGSPSHGCSG